MGFLQESVRNKTVADTFRLCVNRLILNCKEGNNYGCSNCLYFLSKKKSLFQEGKLNQQYWHKKKKKKTWPAERNQQSLHGFPPHKDNIFTWAFNSLQLMDYVCLHVENNSSCTCYLAVAAEMAL